MDLVPRFKKVDSIHFNWGGWSRFTNFLSEIGCTTQHLSGSNDGDYIPAKVCKEISSLLEEHKNEFYTLYYEVGWCNDPLNPCGELKYLEERINEIIEFFWSCGGCRQF